MPTRNITIGDTSVKELYIGTGKVLSVHLGDTLIYGSGAVEDITQTNGTLIINAVYSTTITQTNGTLKIV